MPTSKKTLKTIKETPKGKNLKSIDTMTGIKSKNKSLVEETRK